MTGVKKMIKIISVGAATAFLITISVGSVRAAEEAAPEKKSPDVGALIGDLKGTDQAKQMRAKAVLVGMGEAAGPLLLQSLASASPEEEGTLIEILAIIRYREAASAIEQIWQKADDPRLKLRAAEALCRFDYNYARYQGYILSQITQGDEDYRLFAMQMLGYIEDKRVVEPLVKIFNDPEESDQIRQAAIWDLAHTPAKESAEVLVGMVNNAQVDWFYKEIIISALRRFAARKTLAPIVSRLLEEGQRLPTTAREPGPAEKK